MTKSIVISGPPAVGKTTVAKGLAKEFNLEYLSGGDILKEMAKEQGFDSDGDDWWDTQEGMIFLNQREQNSEFDENLDKKLIALFNKGGMVITSYTLPWLINNGVKIWLEGSHESSTRRMQSRDNMSSENAYIITKSRFDKNRALYKKLYGFSFGEDKSVFDVIINTDTLTANQVIDVTTETVRKLL
ncbi:MAG: cytidylate kinase family protein [Candidatus Nitrosopumilus limneticus]|nr:Cytidylate kinase [Candidatus Nitrosopumilus limneticus]MSS85801.1 AAA family ATPase [Nitrosopumilus sp.]PHY04373.1 MAG: cytidylate kinase [Nitrososphaerota archaeon]MDC4211705.1 cytidylate kinase family protein [Candidatus Nitrosopumilus limneticus]MDC4214587.1 cytidylate kinase family protein [Candidatus Nitrosopumilus limneticus]